MWQQLITQEGVAYFEKLQLSFSAAAHGIH